MSMATFKVPIQIYSRLVEMTNDLMGVFQLSPLADVWGERRIRNVVFQHVPSIVPVGDTPVPEEPGSSLYPSPQ